MNKPRRYIQPIVASVIVLTWLYVGVFADGTQNPSIELRIMVLTSLIWLFGDSVARAMELVRGQTTTQTNEMTNE